MVLDNDSSNYSYSTGYVGSQMKITNVHVQRYQKLVQSFNNNANRPVSEIHLFLPLLRK